MAPSSTPDVPTAPTAPGVPAAGPGDTADTSDTSPAHPGAVPVQIAAGATESSAFAHAPPPPALLPALALFERGDFLAARRELDRLVAAGPSAPHSGPPDLLAATRSLRARLDIDPAAFVVGGVALGLLALVATTYLF
jgi:hypothetical protein